MEHLLVLSDIKRFKWLRLLLLVGMLVCFGFATVPVLSQSGPIEIDYYKVQTLDLLQNGSLSNPYIANASLDAFTTIESITIIVHFTSNQYVIEKFGGDTNLANGIYVRYAGESFIFNGETLNISSNDDIQQWTSPYYERISDDLNPKQQQLTGTFFFPKGLLHDASHALQFYVQDDITALTTVDECNIRINGYHTYTYLATQDVNSKPDNYIPLISEMSFVIASYWPILLLSLLGLILIVRKYLW